jgi:hypothetical protein
MRIRRTIWFPVAMIGLAALTASRSRWQGETSRKRSINDRKPMPAGGVDALTDPQRSVSVDRDSHAGPAGAETWRRRPWDWDEVDEASDASFRQAIPRASTRTGYRGITIDPEAGKMLVAIVK